MKISVKELIELLETLNKKKESKKNNNVSIKLGQPVYFSTGGIMSIKTGTTEKTKPESFLNIYGVGGEYIPEGGKNPSPTVTGSGNKFEECKHNLVINKICHDCNEDFRETYFAPKAEMINLGLENKILELNSKIDISQKENQELKSKITKLEGLHKLLQASCKETISSYENKIKEHQDINYKLCEEKRKLEKENSILETRIYDRDRIIENLKNELLKKNSENQNLKLLMNL